MAGGVIDLAIVTVSAQMGLMVGRWSGTEKFCNLHHSLKKVFFFKKKHSALY